MKNFSRVLEIQKLREEFTKERKKCINANYLVIATVLILTMFYRIGFIEEIKMYFFFMVAVIGVGYNTTFLVWCDMKLSCLRCQEQEEYEEYEENLF